MQRRQMRWRELSVESCTVPLPTSDALLVLDILILLPGSEYVTLKLDSFSFYLVKDQRYLSEDEYDGPTWYQLTNA